MVSLALPYMASTNMPALQIIEYHYNIGYRNYILNIVAQKLYLVSSNMKTKNKYCAMTEKKKRGVQTMDIFFQDNL